MPREKLVRTLLRVKFPSIKGTFEMFIWKITPTCAEMTRLASQSQDRRLTILQRVRIRLHFLICVWCKRYFQQLAAIRATARSCAEQEPANPESALSPEAKERIARAIDYESA